MSGLAVVAGTSRDFGRACTEELADADWEVVALVRTAEDAASWHDQPGVHPVVHDIRSRELTVLLDTVGRRPVDAHRAEVLDAAYAAHPERFVRHRPQPAPLPEAAWINPPQSSTIDHAN